MDQLHNLILRILNIPTNRAFLEARIEIKKFINANVKKCASCASLAIDSSVCDDCVQKHLNEVLKDIK